MGGIDHGQDAGIVLVVDHRIFKGQKIWTWGNNEVQRVWDEKLTDSDDLYAELMMGFYSDNQPDYNFLAPFETKHSTMYMYGIKSMSALKQAGQRLHQLVKAQHAPRVWHIVWNGADENGIAQPSGVYYARLTDGEYVRTVKLALVR